MRVLKFGGTSLATVERRTAVARIIAGAAHLAPTTVVVSALDGVTDVLEAALGGGPRPDLRALAERHCEGLADSRDRAAVCARIAELGGLLDGVSLLGECPPATRHRVLASGERLAVIATAAALARTGIEAVSVDAAELLVTGASETAVDLAASRRRILRHRCFARRDADRNAVPVVPGFIAATPDGRTTTLGRGASDLSATLLGAALDAEEVEIWTDVDGVLSAPPHLVPGAFPLPRLSYGEATAMAHFGAEVLHPRCLEPLAARAIPVRIRNTSYPASAGTRIGPGASAGARAIAVVAAASRLRLRAPWRVPQLTSRAFAGLEELGIRPLLTLRGSAAQTLTLVLRDAEAAAVGAWLKRELPRGVEITRHDDTAVLAVVGGGPWTSAVDILRVLSQAGVEPLGFSLLEGDAAATATEPAAAVLVPRSAAARAAGLLHDELVGRRRVRPAA